jgi:hypothetical protein
MTELEINFWFSGVFGLADVSMDWGEYPDNENGIIYYAVPLGRN